MKKIILSVIAVFVAFVMLPIVKAETPVKVYMFTKNGCPACASAEEYFEGILKDEPGLFDLVTLEVWDGDWNIENQDLYNLINSVYEYFNEDTKKMATPTIIIGDYHTIGLPQDTSIVYDTIKGAKDSDENKDVVKDLAKELNIDVESLRLKNENVETESGKYDALIIVGIFVVLIGGFAGLIMIGKK